MESNPKVYNIVYIVLKSTWEHNSIKILEKLPLKFFLIDSQLIFLQFLDTSLLSPLHISCLNCDPTGISNNKLDHVMISILRWSESNDR